MVTRALRGDTPVATLSLRVAGEHMRRNALAALAAAAAAGIDPVVAANSLAGFSGTGRRFELKGEARGITVIDALRAPPDRSRRESAHGARAFRGATDLGGLQHTYSRTKLLLHEFAEALALADRLVLLDIYASRERDTLGMSSDDLLPLLPASDVVLLGPGQPDDATALLAEYRAGRLSAGAVAPTLGAGRDRGRPAPAGRIGEIGGPT